MIVPRWLASRAVQPEGRRLNDGWAISVIVDELPCCYCLSTLTRSRRTESSRAPSSPSIRESLWSPETDDTYESSILRASPLVQSIAFPEGLDISFNTSFLRPTASAYSSQEQSRLSTIDESPSS